MKKSFAIILALMLVSSSIISCSQSTVTEENAAEGEIAAEQNAVSNDDYVEEEEVNPLDTLPEGDFSGADFMILNDTYSDWWTISLWSEGLDGEIINDTVYKRNTFAEEKYNVKILDTESSGNVCNLVKEAVQSGSDDYDMVWERISSLLSIAESGFLLNLYSFDGFDFDSTWWDSNAKDAFTINGKLYFGCNDINIHTMEGCSTIYFSKTLREQNNLDNPYDLVREGTWTLEKMGEMMRAVSADTNGDGKRDEGDTFGMVTGMGQYLSLVNGAGVKLVSLVSENGEDSFRLDTDTEDCIDVTAAVSDLLNDENLTVIVNNDSWGYNAFYTDQSLFYIMQLGSIGELRDSMESDFGILPFPMRDEAQGYYTTSMEATAQAICFPQTITNKDKVTLVTECMAIYSDQYLTDAFYETTLKGKIARDQDTNEMLDILTANRTFDYSTCYGSWNVYNSYYTSVSSDGAANLASITAKIQKSFSKLSQKTIDAINALDN